MPSIVHNSDAHMQTVSIVMPTYNGQQYIAQTIDSVLQQSQSDWDLIIIDDGSGAESRAFLESQQCRDGRIRVVWQHNKGIAGARNTGLANVGNDSAFVLFLDHDDKLHPDALTTLLATLEKTPKAVAAAGEFRFIDEHSNEMAEHQLGFRWRCWADKARGMRDADGAIPVTCIMDTNFIPSLGALLIRKEALITTGGFIETLSGVDDWDIIFKLALQGQIVTTPDTTFYYRFHPSNTSADFGFMDRKVAQLRKQWLHLIPNRKLRVTYVSVWLGDRFRERFGWLKESTRDRNLRMAARHALGCITVSIQYTFAFIRALTLPQAPSRRR